MRQSSAEYAPDITDDMLAQLDAMEQCAHRWSRWQKPRHPSRTVSGERACRLCGTVEIRFYVRSLKNARNAPITR
jgi:hypothetical protein